MRQKIYLDYKKNTKSLHFEEPFDYFLYRPLAYFFVKSTYFLPLTPNSISVGALLCAYFSACKIYEGNFFLAGIYLLGFCILDCADGMLARMKKNGHPYGEFIDMVIDVLSTCMIFASLIYTLGNFDKIAISLSLISLFFQVSLYNYVKEYLSQRSQNRNFHLNKQAKQGKGELVLEYIHSLFYTFQQRIFSSKHKSSLLSYGPLAGSSHLTFLFFGLILQQLSIFYIYTLFLSNIYLLFLIFSGKSHEQQQSTINN